MELYYTQRRVMLKLDNDDLDLACDGIPLECIRRIPRGGKKYVLRIKIAADELTNEDNSNTEI